MPRPKLEAALSLSLVLLAALACRGGSTTRSKLAYGSEADIEKLLASRGAAVKVTDCENVRYGDGGTDPLARDPGVTRALSCMLTLTPTQTSALTAGFGMRPAKPSTSSGGPKNGTCASRGFFIGSPTHDAFETRGRAATPGWEYTLLVVERTSGRACFETEYAWS
jgi:hypothetical protein